MKTVEIIFWVLLGIVVYTYLVYGILLYLLMKFREFFFPRKKFEQEGELPEMTLLIAAYNEQDVVAAKMDNCRGLDYPSEKLKIVWITDGSNDMTDALLKSYPDITVLHENERRGKTAALNRAMQFISTPIVVMTDANTMINMASIKEIAKCFLDPKVGCVAGEKRVMANDHSGAAGTEGAYWKYESKLKEWDDRLHTAVGAAGELYAIRRNLWHNLPDDTLLDDFVCSMLVAADGFRIAYCKEAFALETPSADMEEEGKRKKRICAGGLQSVWRLRFLLNPKYGMLWFQYVSHRVLRWTLAPLSIVTLFPLNIVLLFSEKNLFIILMCAQVLFYLVALLDYIKERNGSKGGILTVPYYFLFMNLNVFKGIAYLRKHKGSGSWERAKLA